MITRRPASLAHLAAVGALALLTACASAQVAGTRRLTPVKQRTTDEAIVRDLAVFDSYERRVTAAVANPAGAEKYLASRAVEYVRIARDAYERNDRSDFVEDALAWAAADIETLERGGAAAALPTAIPMPKGTTRLNEPLWARAEALRRSAGTLGAPDELARAEGQLMRAGHEFLAGPACLDDVPSSLAARLLDTAERSRSGAGAALAPTGGAAAPTQAAQPIPTPIPTPTPVPTPTPTTRPAAPAPRACTAPERLVGVPTIVHFALDRSTLAPATREVLDRLAEALRPYSGVRVVVSGHTDFRASDGYNQALSERRANAVRTYLLGKGLTADRLEMAGYGEKRLLTHTDAPMDHARNRRVAITYTLCDGTVIEPVEGLSDLQLEASRRARAQMKEKD